MYYSSKVPFNKVKSLLTRLEGLREERRSSQSVLPAASYRWGGDMCLCLWPMFVFVPIFVCVFANVVTDCLSYSLIQMQRCLETAEKLCSSNIFRPQLNLLQRQLLPPVRRKHHQNIPWMKVRETKRMCWILKIKCQNQKRVWRL